ncbi:RNA dependent RNA polymerase [Aspergillus undulatus]|uniref:RNA dependent RNA polymerase n=1 Tax=Aspergillus undulatus TaxID=1810928 RepID=UPI003CCDDE3E
MEAFLHNLPRDLSEDALKDLIAPFMRSLTINDWLCTKPKKKPFGFILFLSTTDGQRFLASHGEIESSGQARSKSRLNLLGSHVFCKKSKREPAEHDLRHLAWQAQERINPTRIIEDEGNTISFNLFRSSCGYTTFNQQEFVYVPEIQWQHHGVVSFKRRNIIVELGNTYRIRIPLSIVFEVIWDKTGSLLVTLMNVPFFFRPEGESRTRLSSLGGPHFELVGQCLVYQFQVDPTQIQSKMNQLKVCDLAVIRYEFQTIRYFESWQSQLAGLKQLLADYTRDGTLPFGILFQMQALVHNGYLPPYIVSGLTKELASVFKLRKMAGKRPISVNAVKKLFNLVNWPSPFGDPEEFTVNGLLEMITGSNQGLHNGMIHMDSLFRPTPHLAYIHRLTVTPSRITLHGPEVEPLNRILRRFPNHHEYFVRIQFCDENGQDVQFNPKINNEEVFARFKTVLESGIQIAGRTYTFLGFSHSSLRSHSVWFAAPFVDDNENLQTYFTIIKAIGTFANITSPARCAARIGQAFSDTPFAVNLKENGIAVYKIPDVEVGKRVYSDGVGTISRDAVDTIHSILPTRKGLPTCFQIRLGGAKGMLSLDPLLKGSQIRIRPSMVKFDAENRRDVEICGSGSKPIPLVLNRQVIKIMEDMGVSDDWFLKLQGLRVEQLRKATATIKNTANFIKNQGIGDCIRIYRLLLLFHKLKLNYKEVPFLRAVVEAAVLRELRLLKHKARIPVRKGITLFGIMDETGFLEENQVFVTYDTMDGRFAPPPGPCRLLVTRSPALHDGDIQYAHHVLPPARHPLLQHKNCIVFSQKGARDLPSQLSGGDLDGDLYNIIWDPEAAPLNVFAPADYPRVPPKDIQRLVTRTDMAGFFVEFMESDKLGVIATKHMILADQMEFGTSHSDCKKLAQLHSTAVDFSKTGVPVNLSEMPFVNRNRPDFLAPGPLAQIHHKEDIQLEARYIHPYPDDDDTGPVHKYYRSEKILGRLYRAIDEHKIWSEEIRSTVAPHPKTVWRKLVDSLTARCITFGASVNWQGHVETAKQLRAAYEDAITTAMANFSDHPIHPITELEVFIGQILNNSGIQTHRQRERSIKLKDEFERIASWILGQMRPAGPITGYASEYDTLERCLACFHIAIEEKNKAAHRRRGWDELESFRVVAACALLMEVEVLEKTGNEIGVAFTNRNENENVPPPPPVFVPGASTEVESGTRDRDLRSAGYGYWNAGGKNGNVFNTDALLRSLGVQLGGASD